MIVPGRHRLHAPEAPNEIRGLPELTARFWLQGSGWAVTSPVDVSGASAALEWTVPAALDLCAQDYYVQFYSRGTPVSPPSRVVSFSTRGVPCLTAEGIVNAASFLGGSVSPGEIVTLFGAGLGPRAVAGFSIVDGAFDTQAADTRVLFDGVPAPLVYVHARQTSAVVPYQVSGRTQVQVEYRGVRSDSVLLDAESAKPALFTQNSSGQGAGAILNQDFSLNTGAVPASAGSVVLLFATGAGQTNPAGVDGRIASDVLPVPRLAVTAELIVNSPGQQTRRPIDVLYAGAAPGLVSGMLQVNIRIPPESPPGAMKCCSQSAAEPARKG